MVREVQTEQTSSFFDDAFKAVASSALIVTITQICSEQIEKIRSVTSRFFARITQLPMAKHIDRIYTNLVTSSSFKDTTWFGALLVMKVGTVVLGLLMLIAIFNKSFREDCKNWILQKLQLLRFQGFLLGSFVLIRQFFVRRETLQTIAAPLSLTTTALSFFVHHLVFKKILPLITSNLPFANAVKKSKIASFVLPFSLECSFSLYQRKDNLLDVKDMKRIYNVFAGPSAIMAFIANVIATLMKTLILSPMINALIEKFLEWRASRTERNLTFV